jgi:fatty acid/phospholipid biosynthesis enzyme
MIRIAVDAMGGDHAPAAGDFIQRVEHEIAAATVSPH